MSNKIIGQGTFGCVIKPALKCNSDEKIDDKYYRNKVSKVMFDKHALDELKELEFISKLDGIEKYAMSIPKICNPKLDDRFNKIVQRCRTPPTRHVYHFFRSDKTKLKQLLLEDGGNDMKTAAEDLLIRNKTDPNKTKFFYTSFLNLFDGLIFFN